RHERAIGPADGGRALELPPDREVRNRVDDDRRTGLVRRDQRLLLQGLARRRVARAREGEDRRRPATQTCSLDGLAQAAAGPDIRCARVEVELAELNGGGGAEERHD